ncbi:hypothetical protein SARC_08512 [Sphaeroforma arctica JP610]|uniref:Ppx/GppA phosphatase N-terminal domain-containing protein n=1 Tax=Sphaeroforma arctica JP610 TaxID=667725 RepID=A0A0L0FQP2_9EUKA|nr:hypothetical protein SARC_08512 [Sphaeroforma arctica JP610]KNC79080.1 hypothetical protein SARC_08512 [Sphaeroforma arctica JP610]|eukprot:XP_014152982.1 hypothetical protein SARC_08512 [Sphaeroforma arctica JP610]
MSVIRAAFDVGSGSTKLTVGQIELATGHLTKVFFSEERVVEVGKSFRHHKEFIAPEMLELCRNKLTEFKSIALSHGATQWAGVATAVFREKSNGKFIEDINSKLGLNLRVVSQTAEAELGYATAVAVKAVEGVDANEQSDRHTVVWDSGGASFQIATKTDDGLLTAEGQWGSSSATHTMVAQIQGKDFTQTESANPGTMEHVHKLISHIQSHLQPPPAWLIEMQKEGLDVVAIGGDTSMHKLVSLATRNPTFTPETIMEALEMLADKSDEELSYLPQPDQVLPKMCLAYVTMKTMNIKEARHYQCTGNTLGLLITDSFWPIAET